MMKMRGVTTGLLMAIIGSAWGCGTPAANDPETGTTASAIRSGTAVTTMDDVVAVLGNNLCSGTFVGRRCVLTAAHCDATEVQQDTQVGYDYTANAWARGNKWAKVLPRKPGRNRQELGPSHDLQVLWTAPPKDLAYPEFDRDTGTIEARDYTPHPMSFEKARPGTRAELFGYGPIHQSGDNSIDSGIKRTGSVEIKGYRYDGVTPKGTIPGFDRHGVYAVDGEGRDFNATCGGDSGGPLFANGSLIGVNVLGLCDANKTSIEAGLYAQEAWVKRTIDDVCAPKFSVAVRVDAPFAAAPQGRIVGHANGRRIVSCSTAAGDCDERDLPAGRIVLKVKTLEPQRSHFTRWANKRGECPCDDPTSSTCEFTMTEGIHEQEFAGYTCVAEFADDKPGTGPGAPPPAPPGGGSAGNVTCTTNGSQPLSVSVPPCGKEDRVATVQRGIAHSQCRSTGVRFGYEPECFELVSGANLRPFSIAALLNGGASDDWSQGDFSEWPELCVTPGGIEGSLRLIEVDNIPDAACVSAPLPDALPLDPNAAANAN